MNVVIIAWHAFWNEGRKCANEDGRDGARIFLVGMDEALAKI